jgi:anti-anti-sigma factor
MPDPATISTSGLSLHISALEGAIFVQCHGTLTFDSSDFLRREVKSRIPDKGRVVLDLSEVTRMDSSGLGAIVGLYLSARSRSCNFDVINFNKQIRNLFAISNLLSIFETCGRQGIRMP